MKFKRTLTGMVIASSLCLPVARADNSPPHNSPKENKAQYEKEEVNPIYLITAIILSLAAAASGAYYAMRERRKNYEKQEKLDNK